MKKHILRILGLLILYAGGGALTTVGVAWGLASLHMLGPRVPVLDEPPWSVDELIRLHADRAVSRYEWSVVAFESGAVGSTMRGVMSSPTLGSMRQPTPGVDLVERTAGLPCRAFIGARWLSGPSLLSSAAIDNPVRTQAPGAFAFSSEFLPLRPIFPGFLVNTLFYAAMWFGIFFGVAALRRFIRKRRGRCVKCGYDLRGDVAAGCPECGWGRLQ